MMKIHRYLGIASACLIATGPAWGLDLLGAYQRALTNDANYLAARATAESAREAIPQARAGLLPNIAYSNNRSNNGTTQNSETILGPKRYEYDYLAKSESLGLRQPLLRVDRIVQLGQAESQVAAAEATLEKEEQALAVRLAGAYFDTLLAQERLTAILTQKDAYAAQQKLAERAFAAGEGTRTDIDDARARFLVVAAQEIEVRNAVNQAERLLAAIIGEPIGAAALRSLDGERLRGQSGEMKSLASWLAQAEEVNPELRAMRHNVEVAQAEIDRYRAQHLPTADLIASHSYSSSENNTSVGNTYRTNSIGIQLTIPIYSGGQINSAVRQAVANKERARQQLEAALRQLSVNVAKEFNAHAHGAVQVRAYEEALEASRQVLASTRKGILAGVRNTVDALNAEQQLADTGVNLARARMEFALAGIRLSAAAGILAEQDIARLNGWLKP